LRDIRSSVSLIAAHLLILVQKRLVNFWPVYLAHTRGTGLSIAADAPESTMEKALTRFLADESGATAIDYALIASIVSLVVISSSNIIANNLKNVFNKASGNLT
jgi:pilus assembly protein Flp/PilA